MFGLQNYSKPNRYNNKNKTIQQQIKIKSTNENNSRKNCFAK